MKTGKKSNCQNWYLHALSACPFGTPNHVSGLLIRRPPPKLIRPTPDEMDSALLGLVPWAAGPGPGPFPSRRSRNPIISWCPECLAKSSGVPFSASWGGERSSFLMTYGHTFWDILKRSTLAGHTFWDILKWSTLAGHTFWDILKRSTLAGHTFWDILKRSTLAGHTFWDILKWSTLAGHTFWDILKRSTLVGHPFWDVLGERSSF